MKKVFNNNIWIIALSLVLLTFLGYQAIEKESCIEASYKIIRIGFCDQKQK